MEMARRTTALEAQLAKAKKNVRTPLKPPASLLGGKRKIGGNPTALKTRGWLPQTLTDRSSFSSMRGTINKATHMRLKTTVQQKPCAVSISTPEAEWHVETNPLFPLACALTILVALALRIYQLGRDPLWFDEVMYGYLANHLSREVMSGSFLLAEPAFILMLKSWLMLGHGDTWIRCHAVLAGMAALYPAWLLGRRLAGRRGALYCLIFLAPAPMLVFYSRDAKMYGWVILFLLALVYLGMRCSDEDAKLRHFAAYVLFATLLCNTHFAAPLYLAPLNLFVLVLFARRGKQTLAWLFAQIVVVVCSIPFILMELRYMKAMQGKIFHAPVPSLRSLWVTLHNLLTAYSPENTLHVAGVILAILLSISGLLFLSGHRKALLFMLAISASSVAMLFGLSHILRWSLYIDRYVVGAAGPLLIVMALGGASLPWRPLRALAVMAWLAVCCFALHDLYAKHISTVQQDHLGVIPTLDARSMAKTINEQGQPGDVVWHVFWETEVSLRWYLPHGRHVLVDMGGQAQSNLDMLCNRPYQAFHQWHPVELEQLSANVSRVWLVLPGPGAGVDASSRGILEWLKARGTMLARFESDPRYSPATFYLFDLQKTVGDKDRKTAELSLQGLHDPLGTNRAGQVTINAVRSQDNTEIVLDAKNNSDAQQSFPYEILFSDLLCPASRFDRSLGEHSLWSIQLYLANGKLRTGMVFRIHKQADPQDVLTYTTRFPKGEYRVYIEYTIKGRVYAIPTASFRIDMDAVQFETPYSTPDQPGGWIWHYMGNVNVDQEKNCLLTVSAHDPENRPEAYAVMSRIAFLRTPESGVMPSEIPTQAAGTITLQAKGETTERILFPAEVQCANILVQGPADIAELLVTRYSQ